MGIGCSYFMEMILIFFFSLTPRPLLENKLLQWQPHSELVSKYLPISQVFWKAVCLAQTSIWLHYLIVFVDICSAIRHFDFLLNSWFWSIWSLASPVPIQLPADWPGKGPEDGSRVWTLAIHVRASCGVLKFLDSTCPNLVHWSHLENILADGRLYLSLFL